MVPTEGIRNEPICERIAVVVRPPIPMTVARPLNSPQEFLSALAAFGIFNHGHRQNSVILNYRREATSGIVGGVRIILLAQINDFTLLASNTGEAGSRLFIFTMPEEWMNDRSFK